MSLSDFLSPLDLDSISPENGFYTSHLGSKIVAFHDDFPDLDSGLFDIALIGVLEAILREIMLLSDSVRPLPILSSSGSALLLLSGV